MSPLKEFFLPKGLVFSSKHRLAVILAILLAATFSTKEIAQTSSELKALIDSGNCSITGCK